MLQPFWLWRSGLVSVDSRVCRFYNFYALLSVFAWMFLEEDAFYSNGRWFPLDFQHVIINVTDSPPSPDRICYSSGVWHPTTLPVVWMMTVFTFDDTRSCTCFLDDFIFLLPTWAGITVRAIVSIISFCKI